jgi:WD40 repeat protein
MGRTDPDATITAGTTAGGGPAAGGDELPSADPERYQILDELARGGHGRILRAHDRKLDRPVALKVPLRPEGAFRFAREARITARLQHPAIVPVYEAGRGPSGEPFCVMKLVVGRTLREVIAERPSLDARLQLIPNLIAVSDAVAYAHAQRIVHRDLKPANVLVGSYGETVVLDWGVAKDLAAAEAPGGDGEAASDDGTTDGSVRGTPAYMPPEQALKKSVDERADVYALGAMLHHLLTGAPPYSGRSPAEVLAQLAEGPPPDVISAAPHTPPDLATVVRKAMARDPAGRYPTARELADELRRYHAGQLVAAHPYSGWQLVTRWVARHRAAVTVALAMTLALATMGVVSVRRLNAARQQSEARRIDAEGRRDELLLLQARQSLGKDPTAAVAWLKQYRGANQTAAAELALRASATGVALESWPRIGFFDMTADGRRLVRQIDERVLYVEDRAGGPGRRLEMPEPDEAIGMSADGKQLASFSRAKILRLFPVDGGAARTVWTSQGEDSLLELHFSPDQSALAGFTGKNHLWIWDVASGRHRDVAAHPLFIHQLAWSPDGKWLATASSDKTVAVWSRDGEARHHLRHEAIARAVAFAPDGRSLISASDDGAVRRWDLASGQPTLLGRHESRVFGVAVSPDGATVASVGADKTVRLWAGGKAAVLRGHDGPVIALAFSPDGAQLATAGEEQTVRLWDLATGGVQVLRGHDAPVVRLWYRAGFLTSRSLGDQMRLWRVQPARYQKVAELAGEVRQAAFSPDGKQLAIAGRDPAVQLCEAPRGPCRALPGSPAEHVAFSPDGAQLAAAGLDGVVRLRSVATGEERLLRGHHGRVTQLAFAPDGAALATVGEDRTVRRWDLTSGAGQILATHGDLAVTVCFTSDGKQIVSAGFDGALHVWDQAGSRVLRGHRGWIVSIACAPDGPYVASGSFDNQVRWWDLTKGESRVLGTHEGPVQSVAIANGRVASGGVDRVVRVWSPKGGPGLELLGHEADVTRLGFSRDGATLASVGEDRVLRVWEIPSGRARLVPAHDAAIRIVTFAPDGKFLITGSADRTARAWELAAIPSVPEGGVSAFSSQLTRAEIQPNRPAHSPPDP